MTIAGGAGVQLVCYGWSLGVVIWFQNVPNL